MNSALPEILRITQDPNTEPVARDARERTGDNVGTLSVRWCEDECVVLLGGMRGRVEGLVGEAQEGGSAPSCPWIHRFFQPACRQRAQQLRSLCSGNHDKLKAGSNDSGAQQAAVVHVYSLGRSTEFLEGSPAIHIYVHIYRPKAKQHRLSSKRQQHRADLRVAVFGGAHQAGCSGN